MNSTITPRTLKGFRDFKGDELKLRKSVLRTFESIFEKYGFEGIETPALEYFDILMGKYGEEEKLVYNFEDFGGRKVALKYDLTVPTARVLAQYGNEISLPWKRYQMQPVWRADNTQRGRYRELWQCDADTFGSPDMIAESEFASLGIEALSKLGFKEFALRLNNRKILNAIAKYAGREDKFYDVVYAIDKWKKRSLEETESDLITRGLSKEETAKVIECVNTTDLNLLRSKFELIEEGQQGVDELIEIIETVNDQKVTYDPTIARGLAYYTGPVWEWEIIDGNIGSIGGGGRYDKLVGSFLGRDIPAVGGAFGIERIIDVMKDRNMSILQEKKNKVLVTSFDKASIRYSLELASGFREKGWDVTVYPQYRPIGKQIEYASKRGFQFVVIAGENEISENTFSFKNLDTGKQDMLKKTDIPSLSQDL